jgi:hypothetical protein
MIVNEREPAAAEGGEQSLITANINEKGLLEQGR